MLPVNDYLLERECVELRVKAIQDEVSRERLGRSSVPALRARLACQWCRMLWQLGAFLADAGRRLEQRYAAAALSRA